MNNINVLMVKKFFKADIDYMESKLDSNIDLIQPDDFSPEGLIRAYDKQQVLLGDSFPENLLEKGQNSLKLLQIPWTGVDRLNFELLQKFPYMVCNSHSNALPVAEMALGLAFSIAKKIPLHDRKLRTGNWMRPVEGDPDSFVPPTLLHGKTIGFIGFGAIASKTAQLLSGFGVTMIATDALEHPNPPAYMKEIYSPDKIYDVAEMSDIVFIALPLTPKTKELIDDKFFEAMKDSAYLINTSRGEVLHEESLYNALANKKIAGAGIDTWYQYPSPGKPTALPSASFPFHELDNLVLSSHRSGFVQGDMPHLTDVIDNLNRFARGEELINKVDLQRGF